LEVRDATEHDGKLPLAEVIHSKFRVGLGVVGSGWGAPGGMARVDPQMP